MPIDMTSAPKAPPLRRATPPKTATKPSKTEERTEGTTGFLQAATLGCVLGRQYADAGAISKHGPAFMREAVALAETNEPVARVVDFLCMSGPLAGLFAAGMPLVLQILANHKIIPAEPLINMGLVVHPDALTAEVAADIASQQMQALKAQQAAEKQLAEMQAQMTTLNGAAQSS